jgi:hypothetical protein
VRRPDGASRNNGAPAGISTGLQVSPNSGEPFKPSLSRNLLSKHRCRATLGDEAVKSGPDVALVGMATLLSSDRKRLTGCASSPDFAVLRPAGEGERAGPAENSAEEMALPKRSKVCGIDIKDASLINLPVRQQPRLDQFPPPSAGEGVVIVVVDRHYSRRGASFA